ncbi:MAG: alpha-E domain-containing protein [Gammaproteobacteria bacterium]|nr:alpha-E domain-containing protein [Gammaproteobacteria bacterium]
MTAHTLSSTAQRSYWLGRYLERTETSARLVTVHANLLIDMPTRMPLGWRPLVAITGSADHYDELFDDTLERSVCRFLINDQRNPGSLIRSLSWAKENARTLRGIIPRPAFEFINEAYLYARENLTEPLSRTRRISGLNKITEYIQQVDGYMSANMLHDSHWNFLRIGHFIERADMTTRLIDAGTGTFWDSAAELEPFADIQWRSVLRALYALQSYNTSMGEPITQGPVIDFLMNDPRLPRSVAYGLNSLRNNLRSLPRHDKPLRAVNRIRREIAGTSVRDMNANDISDFLDQCQVRLNLVHEEIHRTYFDFRPRRKRRRSQ